MIKRTFILLALTFALSSSAMAQTSTDALATVNGRNLTPEDLPRDIRDAYVGIPETVRKNRTALLGGALAQMLAEAEAAARGVTVDKLFDAEIRARVSEPTDQELKAFYVANQNALGGTPFETVKPRIATYLRQQAEMGVQQTFVDSLKAKYKPLMGKDVNATDLKETDTLVTVGTKTLTKGDFEEKFKEELYSVQADIYDAVKEALEYAVYNTVVSTEASARGIGSGDLIAREITDKMKLFTTEETAGLEAVLKKTLFTKYKVAFMLKVPPAPVFDVATADDPTLGAATAPVTIVMFSDFQCPACSAAHPIAKKARAQYGEKVRLQVRDFPLEGIHDSAFNAARAAGAAAKQNKFFEYIELLYANQTALGLESLRSYARKIGLNMQRFEVDFNDPKTAEEIRKDQTDGVAVSITGTPTFFINGVRLRNGSEEGFRQAIEEALEKAARPAAK